MSVITETTEQIVKSAEQSAIKETVKQATKSIVLNSKDGQELLQDLLGITVSGVSTPIIEEELDKLVDKRWGGEAVSE